MIVVVEPCRRRGFFEEDDADAVALGTLHLHLLSIITR